MQPTARLAAAASPHLCTSTHAISISPRPPRLTSPHLTSGEPAREPGAQRRVASRRVGAGRAASVRDSVRLVLVMVDEVGGGGGDAEL